VAGRLEGRERRTVLVAAWLLLSMAAIVAAIRPAPATALQAYEVVIVLTGNGTGTLLSTNASYVSDGVISCHREAGVTTGTCSHVYPGSFTFYWRQNPSTYSNTCNASAVCYGLYITGFHSVGPSGYTVNASFVLKTTSPAPSTKPSTPKPSTKPATPRPATPRPPTQVPVTAAPATVAASDAPSVAPESLAPGESAAQGESAAPVSLAPGQTAAPSSAPTGGGSPTSSSGPSPIILAVLFAGLMLAIAIAFLGWQLGRRRT